MNLQQTVQQASTQRLHDIDPNRVFAYEVDTPALIPCATDYLDGAGCCYLVKSGQQEVEVLCLKCAVNATEGWLSADPDCIITVAVTR